MAARQPRPKHPDSRLSPDRDSAGRRQLRRAILLVVGLFAAYAILTSLGERAPGWASIEPEELPARLSELTFEDGVLAARKPYVIRIKRTGRKRALPSERMSLSVLADTRVTYRCDKRTRCPWIRVGPLSCSLDAEPSGPCGFELFEFGRTGIKLLPQRRCRLTRPNVRDLNVACPHTLVLGPKLPADPAAKPQRRNRK